MRSGLIAVACLLTPAVALAQSVDWPGVGNDPGCMRYSLLAQISRGERRARLKPAWTYHTEELEGRQGKTIECTPVVVGGVMYLTTGYLRVVALEAATGEELWQFDPLKAHPFGHEPMSGGVNRGCAYWSDGKVGGARRIIHGTSDGRLFSLDAKDGTLDREFGRDGIRDLRTELPPEAAALGYGPTSAPAIWKDTIIVGVACGEGPGIAAPGDVRAFDVRTGEETWRFRTVPRPGEFGNDTWVGESWKDRGGANAWGGLSVDADRALIFAGLGSAAFDFYGGDRHGDNLFANCTVALDAKTGRRVWHYQTFHHDLWGPRPADYPNLVSVTHDGEAQRRRGAGHEDRIPLPVRPGEREAALRRQGAAGAASDMPGGRRRRRSRSRSSRPPSRSSRSTSRTSPTLARPTGCRSWRSCGRSGEGRPSTRRAPGGRW